MVLGRLAHYAIDALLLSTVVAGVKRSTGFTCVRFCRSECPPKNSRVFSSSFSLQPRHRVLHLQSYRSILDGAISRFWRNGVQYPARSGGDQSLFQAQRTRTACEVKVVCEVRSRDGSRANVWGIRYSLYIYEDSLCIHILFSSSDPCCDATTRRFCTRRPP